MAVTKIVGRQIADSAITNAHVAAGAAIALSKLAEAVIQADGGQAFTGDQSMGSHKLTNVTDPTSAQDAATKAYVDTHVASLSGKAAVRAAATTDITLSGTQTIDGVALSAGDRVLLTGQTDDSENGIYDVASGAWARSSDMDAWTEVPGALVVVEEGTTNHDTIWLSTANLGGTLETTTITMTKLPLTGYSAGNGLSLTGTTFAVVAADNSITVSGSGVAAKLDSNGAIEINGSSGLRVKLDGSTLARSSSGLKVATGGIADNEIAAGAAIALSKLAATVQEQAKIIANEVPSGTMDSANVTFTLAHTPVKLLLFLNGQLLNPGGGNDYTLSTATITMATAPDSTDLLTAFYVY